MPDCHKCGSTEELTVFNSFVKQKFICGGCKKLQKPRNHNNPLHKKQSVLEWEKKAALINGRIARKYK